MVEEGLVGSFSVLVAQVKVAVGNQALRGQQVEGFIPCDGGATGCPDSYRKGVCHGQQQKESHRRQQ